MESKFKIKCLKTTDNNGHIYDITVNNIYEVFSEFNLNNELQYLIVTNDIIVESIPANLFTKDISNNFICPKCDCLNTKTSYYKSKLQERNMINKLTGTREILDFCIYCGHSIE